MQYHSSNVGFTLIELLVVVLVIGILAAVAVPQYQLAVWKSRFVQLKTTTKQIADAEEEYYMANGKYTTEIDDLAISLPRLTAGYSSASEKYYSIGKFTCNILATTSRSEIHCSLPKDGRNYLTYRLPFQNTSYAPYPQCLAAGIGGKPAASDINHKVCVAETKNPGSRISFGSATYSWRYKS